MTGRVCTVDEPTIFALASGSTRAAISVLRVSGHLSSEIVSTMAGGLPPPRRASLRPLHSSNSELIDRAIVLWLPGPATYTGEDSAELHLHGGAAVLQAAVDALVELGARPAAPGEFSKRAFLNGRMDLLEAEGVADLVAAETDAQRRQALRQVSGAQSTALDDWAARLRRMLAFQEALIDFPDEDLPDETEAALEADIVALADELDAAAREGQRGVRLRDGVVAVVVGAPNAGKSSLVNTLAQRDVSIVSPVPGTTRDAVEASLELGGVPVTLVDTAGLRETADVIEAEGVRRARARAATADIVVHVVDAAAAAETALTLEDGGPAGAARIVVHTKTDLTPAPVGACGISLISGDGLDGFIERLTATVQLLAMPAGGVTLNRTRHLLALGDAVAALREAQHAALPELRGEDLRRALRALGRITGVVDVEAILDTVFGSFCIGK